jgi:hypothetical protein
MKTLSISVLFLAGTFCVLSAQRTLWQKTLPSSSQDLLAGMTMTIDGQYLVGGSSIQNVLGSTQEAISQFSNSGYDYHIVKLSQQGEKLWEKYFGGTRHDYLGTVLAMHDGGFLLGGASYSSEGKDKKDRNYGGSDLWMIRLDENGEEIWQKTIGTSANEEIRSFTETTNGDILVAANIQHKRYGFGGEDVWLIKLDKKGKMLLQVFLGGSGTDEVAQIISTRDGGFLAAISSNSGKSEKKDFVFKQETTETQAQIQPLIIGKESDNFGLNDYWVVKLDKNLNPQWQRNFGGTGEDKIKNISLTDSGFILAGESRSNSSGNKKTALEEGSDLWLVSLNENGEELWQQSYNFKNRDVLMSLNVIHDEKQKTKGILVGGYTQAEEKMQEKDETFWMLYVDKTGKEIWRKYAEGNEKKKEERLVSATLNRDGSYLLAGTSSDELGKEQWKVLKLGDKDLDNLIEKNDLRIFPNPVEDYCYVEVETDIEAKNEIDISVFDMSGKKIQTLKTKNKVTKLNTSSLPQGVYVVSAVTSIGVKKSGKIVKK